MMAVWKLYDFKEEELPIFIDAIDMVVEQLDNDYVRHPIRVLGVTASFGRFGAFASFTISLVLGILLSYMNLQ